MLLKNMIDGHMRNICEEHLCEKNEIRPAIQDMWL